MARARSTPIVEFSVALHRQPTVDRVITWHDLTFEPDDPDAGFTPAERKRNIDGWLKSRLQSAVMKTERRRAADDVAQFND